MERKKRRKPDRKKQPRPNAKPFTQKEQRDSLLYTDSSRQRTKGEESYEFLINLDEWHNEVTDSEISYAFVITSRLSR